MHSINANLAKPEVIIPCSGGLDSMTCAAMAVKQGKRTALLFAEYGQSRAEGLAVRAFAYEWGLPLHEVRLDLGTDTPDGEIPGRNLLILSHALRLALQTGAKAIWWGAGKHDRYKDNSVGFLATFFTLSDIWGVGVHLPLIECADKSEVMALAIANGLDPKVCFSCVGAALTPCGACRTCQQFTHALSINYPAAKQ